ncbi:MAG: cytochrome c biogenesis protein ResB [Myxococcota bacterium]
MRDNQPDELDPEGGAVEEPRTGGALFASYRSFWRFFCSLRLTVVVLILLAAGCVVGMFYDQTLTLEEHRAAWSSARWKLELFTFLELNDVFHSWWFGIVILLLALNLIACSIERLPRIWIDIHNPHRHLTDEQLRGIRHRYQVTLPNEERERVQTALGLLFPRGDSFHEERGEASFAFRERHRYARTGVYVVHVALLIIMFGSMATTALGIDGMMMIVENSRGRYVSVRGAGGLTYKRDLGFEVQCDDFRLKTFIDGAPMDFESDLKIFEPSLPGQPVREKTIQVNDPLEYKGFTFYQASYNPIPGDQLVQLDIHPRGAPKPEQPFVVALGDRVQMPDGVAFVPVEIIREYGGLGAAVRVQKFLPDGTMTTFVVFRSYPEFDAQVRRGEYIVGFRGFDQQYATGIQVGRVPFIEAVFGGFVLMFLGMYMAFFMSHRRYWARLRSLGDGRLELTVAGAARRHQYAFEEEFAQIRTRLETLFGKDDKAARARALRDERARARGGRQRPEQDGAASAQAPVRSAPDTESERE